MFSGMCVVVWWHVPVVWQNGQLNVHVFAGEWMSEWSADGMNVIVLHKLCATQVENWTVLSCYEAYISYDKSVCERDQREKTGIKSVQLEDCFQLQFDWREWIKRTQTTSNQQQASQQHYTIFTEFVQTYRW